MGRRRRPGGGRRCRLVSVAWLVDEASVVDIVALARAAGFSVSVSPTVQVVGGGSGVEPAPPADPGPLAPPVWIRS